jgi:hypothetical protein
LIPAGSLRLYINDTLGLAFLFDPILLESAVTTFVIEWGEVMANQNSRTYITNATEKHAELHTFIYAPRKVRPLLLVFPSVRWLVMTTCRRPLNRTVGITSGSNGGA